MHVSLADIVIAYIVVTGSRQPGDMPYAEAGKKVMDTMGEKTGLKMFARCKRIREANPGKSYEDLAALVAPFYNR